MSDKHFQELLVLQKKTSVGWVAIATSNRFDEEKMFEELGEHRRRMVKMDYRLLHVTEREL